MRALLLIFVLVLSACHTATVAVRDGSSHERAIQIQAKDHGAGLNAEHQWLRQNLPGARLAEGGVNAAGEEIIYFSHRTEVKGRAIFSIYIMQLPDGRVREVYFDQSGYFGKEAKEEPNQPLQRNASTRSVSSFESPALRG
jgi:hypothetical protein